MSDWRAGGVADEVKGTDYSNPLPAVSYIEPELLKRERERVFARTWHVVGHASELNRPGDYFTTELFGEPIILSMDHDRRIRGWYNVCAHRAAKVAEGSGCVAAFRCSYHSWTYGLDGNLIDAPGANEVSSGKYALREVEVSIWCGILFCRLNTDGPTFDEFLGIVSRRTAHLDTASMEPIYSETYTLACNWKVYVENYLEGYHFRTVHPQLKIDQRAYRVDCFDLCSEHHISVVATEAAETEVYRFWVFPSLRLNIFSHVVLANLCIPIDAGTTAIALTAYANRSSKLDVDERLAADREVDRAIQLQDDAVCEQVQKGLASRACQRTPYVKKWEHGVRHFHQIYRRFMDTLDLSDGAI